MAGQSPLDAGCFAAAEGVAVCRQPAEADCDKIEPAALVQIDAGLFSQSFERRPFLVGHSLTRHPLFELPRLVELATRLPAAQVEYNLGDVPVGLDPKRAPLNGLSPAETIRRIEDCNSWLVLKNVERDAEYRNLMERCLLAVREHSESIAPRMQLPEAFVFVSSPRSVTPFHLDPEHNFLFQIRGEKTIHAFDAADRQVVPERDLENFFTGAHRNLRYDESFESRATVWRLRPGDALHLPVAAPHWVQNGDAVSISFSCTFRSARSKCLAGAYAMNSRLRRLGLSPAPVGRSLRRDLMKTICGRFLQRLAGLARFRMS